MQFFHWAKNDPVIQKLLCFHVVFSVCNETTTEHQCQSEAGNETCENNYCTGNSDADIIFRWFKFTLKPPNRITCDKLRLAIWDFFGRIWTQWTLRHILGPILVIFDICHFLTIPGPFECFWENGWSQKIKVFSMKEQSLPTLLI